MSLVVTFADGFTSASAPTIAGSSPEEYSLSNNQASFTDVTGLIINAVDHTTAFFEYELERSDATPSLYRQSGSFIANYDGSAWILEFGSYIGDQLIVDAIANPQDVGFQILSSGQMQYRSGNMTGGSHSATLKLSVTRIAA